MVIPRPEGDATLYANSAKIGEGRIIQTVLPLLQIRRRGQGPRHGRPVDPDKSPYPPTGTFKKVIFDLQPNRARPPKNYTKTFTIPPSPLGSAPERRPGRAGVARGDEHPLVTLQPGAAGTSSPPGRRPVLAGDGCARAQVLRRLRGGIVVAHPLWVVSVWSALCEGLRVSRTRQLGNAGMKRA